MEATPRTIAQQIIADTLANGGATYRLDGQPETSPVTLVGGAQDQSGARIPETIIPVDQLTPEAMAEAFERIAAIAPGARFGTWIEDGRCVIDASDAFEDLIEATAVARQRGERAVYTIGLGETATV